MSYHAQSLAGGTGIQPVHRLKVCATILYFVLSLSTSMGEIIDRIVVTVGNRVITQTEIMREIRITAFLNGEKPDFSAEARRKAADRLIEQKLMRNEIELSRYPAPRESEAEQLLANIKKNHPNFERELKEYNIAEEDLKNQLLWQITVLRFIELRFKPGTRVSEEEIRQEFDKRVVPEMSRSRPGETVNYEDVRDQIEQKLLGERVDKLLDAWLKETRSRTKIKFREEAFK